MQIHLFRDEQIKIISWPFASINQHPAFLDVGYSNDNGVLTTDVIVRCGDPKTLTAVEMAVPLGIAKSGQPFCPEPYTEFIGAAPNDNGD